MFVCKCQLQPKRPEIQKARKCLVRNFMKFELRKIREASTKFAWYRF